jgi:hypothetical protein
MTYRVLTCRRRTSPSIGMRTAGQITTQLISPSAQWHRLSDKTQCREGEAPAEPHPCRERFFDPRCAAKTLASVHSADQRSAARQEPRPSRSSPVFSQNFRESQCNWPSAGWTTAPCHQQPEAFRFVRQASSVGAAWIDVSNAGFTPPSPRSQISFLLKLLRGPDG